MRRKENNEKRGRREENNRKKGRNWKMKEEKEWKEVNNGREEEKK